MNQKEGVIKYKLDFFESLIVNENIEHLNVWRSLMFGLGLIGQHPARYEGCGFGNISARSQNNSNHFIISGTQTGHIENLKQKHYVLVEGCNVKANHVIARGAVKPSSEALTHHMIYQQDEKIQCVIHAHDPDLWNFGLRNKFAFTSKEIEYGTPKMAAEVARIFQSGLVHDSGVLIMAGHEDGIITFGHNLNQAGQLMLDLFIKAKL